MKSKEIRKFRESYKDYKKDCVFEGYKLAVLFDEKDTVKRMGGRWDADASTWWMPEKQLKEDAEQYGGPPNGSLIEDYLNDMQMIQGQYGDFKGPCKGDASEYKLELAGQAHRYTVQWWDDSDAVQFHPSDQNGEFLGNAPKSVWYTVENARKPWDDLIAEGNIRTENS